MLYYFVILSLFYLLINFLPRLYFFEIIYSNYILFPQTPKEQGDQESLTSSEFERFLAERAAAAEALPNLSTVTTTPSTTTSGTNIQRQINKDQDKSLFAL